MVIDGAYSEIQNVVERICICKSESWLMSEFVSKGLELQFGFGFDFSLDII